MLKFAEAKLLLIYYSKKLHNQSMYGTWSIPGRAFLNLETINAAMIHLVIKEILSVTIEQVLEIIGHAIFIEKGSQNVNSSKCLHELFCRNFEEIVLLHNTCCTEKNGRHDVSLPCKHVRTNNTRGKQRIRSWGYKKGILGGN